MSFKELGLSTEILDAVKALRRNEIVAMLGDRIESQKTMVFDFFGRKTAFPVGVAILAHSAPDFKRQEAQSKPSVLPEQGAYSLPLRATSDSARSRRRYQATSRRRPSSRSTCARKPVACSNRVPG